MIHLHYNVGPWLGEGALRILRQADAIVAVSDAVRLGAIEQGLVAERIVTVYNSVVVPPALSEQDRAAARRRLRDELGIAPASIIMGMVARLSEWKGQKEALEAAMPLMADHPELHIVFVGKEDDTGAGLTQRLADAARAAGVSERVRLLGQRSDVPDLLAAFDIFIHPSRHDPCPLAVLEAMAHSLPVVAWREGGIAHLVESETTGILAEPLDLSGLSRAIGRLLAAPDLRSTMGIAGRERAATVFNPDAMSRSFQEVVGRVASARPQG
jgi:glycosyltransferase involved in cell wall biosynthesis